MKPGPSIPSDSAASFSPAVIAPTYNNAGTLCDILDRLERIGYPLFVVNDGSTDSTAERLATWTDAERSIPVTIVTHPRNRGKAAAMRTGFAAARSAGHTHVATIDTDGQLDPEDLPAMFQAAGEAPDAIVLGTRRRDLDGCPRMTRLAWWMSALSIYLETGHRVLDSQCGLRVYPLHVLELVRCKSGRYRFEAEVITRSLWAGCPIARARVTSRYLPPETRVSHFMPGRDGIRSFFMHLALTVRRVNPWPPRRLRRVRTSSTTQQPATCTNNPSPIRVAPTTGWAWIDPRQVWRQLRADRFEQLVLATALGIGAFVAAIPLGGWQILLAAYVARRVHVHALPVVATSLLCLGSVGAGLSKLAIATGYFMLHLAIPDVSLLAPEHLSHWKRLASVPASWPIGAMVVGFFSMWIILPLCERLFRLVPVRHAMEEA